MSSRNLQGFGNLEGFFTELAQRLHWHIPQVDRLLDLGQTSLFEQIEQAAASLGKRVELHIV